MSDSSSRIGCVPYLNARPLLEGLGLALTEMVPSSLFNAFEAGDFDAALLSSIDVISQPEPEVVDGVAIASRGDVYSVILAYSGEIKDLKKVRLDHSSHTSNALAQIILSEFYGVFPEYVQFSDWDQSHLDCDLPAVVIGDPAIAYRKKSANTPMRILDLGAEWLRYTKLPFVYALWLLKKDYTKKRELSNVLRDSKKAGLLKRGEIAARNPDPLFALHYMTDFIRYDLGDEEKRGLNCFAQLLKKYNIINQKISEIKYY